MRSLFSGPASLNCAKALGGLLVLTILTAGAGFVTAQADPSSGSSVRPCTAKERAIGSSPEVIRLFSGEAPVFSWCEAVDVSWLPTASILRFHTAIHVDYSETCTIVKARGNSPLRLIRAAGEGMVQYPSPDRPENLSAMNELLSSAQPAFNDSQLASASILYLFLIGRENRNGIFTRPGSEHPLAEADYRVRYQKQGRSRLLSLSSRTGEWKLAFSLQKNGPHLDSISENGSD
jgi:hypothetical protein